MGSFWRALGFAHLAFRLVALGCLQPPTPSEWKDLRGLERLHVELQDQLIKET